MAAIVLEHVSKVFDGGVVAVDDLQLEIGDGELLVLLGPSGCGKTTTLRIIAGLEEMTSGDLWLGGELANDLPPHHRNIAMVFQQGALYPHLTVRDNLAFPLRMAGPVDKQVLATRVLEIARGLGIENTLGRRPSTLSGGERQRVAMGRPDPGGTEGTADGRTARQPGRRVARRPAGGDRRAGQVAAPDHDLRHS
jgi:multiple sugar transport system ATP-binding protein